MYNKRHGPTFIIDFKSSRNVILEDATRKLEFTYDVTFWPTPYDLTWLQDVVCITPAPTQRQ